MGTVRRVAAGSSGHGRYVRSHARLAFRWSGGELGVLVLARAIWMTDARQHPAIALTMLWHRGALMSAVPVSPNQGLTSGVT